MKLRFQREGNNYWNPDYRNRWILCLSHLTKDECCSTKNDILILLLAYWTYLVHYFMHILWICPEAGGCTISLKCRFLPTILCCVTFQKPANPQSSNTQIFQKSRCHLKVLGARMVTWSKFCTEGPEILGTTVQNLFAPVSWHPGFMHPCLTLKSYCQYVRSFHICCEKLNILTSTVNLLKLKANT